MMYRSADFQSAVSQNCILLGAENICATAVSKASRLQIGDTAD